MNKFIDFDEESQVILPTGATSSASPKVVPVNPDGIASSAEVRFESNVSVTSNLQQEFLSLHEMERQHIMSVLEHTSGNKSEAAKILGITIKSVYNKLHQYQKEGLELGIAAIGKTK